MQAITQIFNNIAEAIQAIREIMNRIRNSIQDIATDLLNRILNIMIPIQKIFIALMDTFGKIQGVMVSGLYTMLGSYYTLQALMGAILELIIKMLITLVIIIVGLWILPFTWPVATTMSAVFLAISIPLAIIVYFMTEVLHVKASAIPSLRCFDKNTKFTLSNYCVKNIQDICVGDVLLNGNIVTAKIKVLSTGLDMYKLNDIIVSGCHIVKYSKKWIPVREHPDAIAIKYNEPYLYCLNTTTKTIVLNNLIFTDWDEVYDDDLQFLLNYKDIKTTENISKVLDSGFDEDVKVKTIEGYKLFKNIEIGDILFSGGIVYGIVELEKNNLGICGNSQKKYNLLVSNKYFDVDGKTYPDYNNNIDSITQLRKLLSKEYV